jgi:hypothetical protein
MMQAEACQHHGNGSDRRRCPCLSLFRGILEQPLGASDATVGTIAGKVRLHTSRGGTTVALAAA